MPRLYLDYNATAPLRPEARAAWLRVAAEGPANPSSVHGFGHRARMEVEAAREEVAALGGVAARDIVFTASATEANNLAIQGAALAAPAARRRIVASAFEHPSVGRVLDHLETRGFTIVRVSPDRDGRVSAEAVAEAAEPATTALVTLMLANHEVGTLQPVAEVAHAIRGRGILLHTDAAQAAGRVPLRVAELGVDLMSIAAHKIGGGTGTGALVVRGGVTLAPLLHGGGQELNRRPGTENVAGIAAFGAAAAAACLELGAEARRLAALRQRLEEGARLLDAGCRVNGAAAPRLPNTTSLFVPGTDSESLVIGLDLEGCAVSAGAACAAGALRRSPSLLAMGLVEEAGASIRISTGAATTPESIDRFLGALGVVMARARQSEPARSGAR